MGYLTSTIDQTTTFDPGSDLRAGFDRFTPANVVANMPFVESIARLAKKKGATTAQLSLAWLLALKPYFVPIPGTGKMAHLRENIGAAELDLTSADLNEINDALRGLQVHGGRMNAPQMMVVEA